MNDYQKMIYYRTYAKGSESWEDCIDRYMNSISRQVLNKVNSFDTSVKSPINFDLLKKSLLNGDIQPSLRLLASAGEYVDKNNLAAYNCSFVPIDSLISFGEIFYLLLSGVGVSVSLEKKHVDKLQIIPKLKNDGNKIIVGDSKEYWKHSLDKLIENLFNASIPNIDYSKIRKRGEPLKSSGGYASGFEVLKDLFDHIINIFKNNEGKRLSTSELFDIICKIADIVVCGGQRRSSILTLIDNDDYDMLTIKTGGWYNTNPHYSNSCISVVHNEKPSMDKFIQHFYKLYKNKNGEAGIYNRYNANRQSERKDESFAPNPCSEIILKPYELCNLSCVNVRVDDTIKSIKNKLILATQIGMIQSLYNDFQQLNSKWEDNIEDDLIIGVSITGIYDNEITANPNKELLTEFKDVVRKESERLAKVFNIKPPLAYTALKPAGNSSQLYNTSSGIHPRYAEYYIRRVTVSKLHPICNFLINNSVHHEESVYNNSNEIFLFYQKAPTGLTDKNVTKLKQLETIRKYNKYYTNHSVSNTITIKDDEFLSVINYIWNHFHDFTGLTMFPEIGEMLQQPYTEITEDEYNNAPKLNIDWSKYSTNFINRVVDCQGAKCDI